MTSLSRRNSAKLKTLRWASWTVALSCWSTEVGATVLQGKSLELVVTTDRSQYRLNDEVRIEVKLVNTGSSPLYVLGVLSWGYGGNLLITFVDDEGREVRREYPEHGGIMPSMAGDRDLVLRLESEHFFGTWRANEVRYFVQKPGRYKVVVEYHLLLSNRDFSVEPFWGKEDGAIESDTFIEVSPDATKKSGRPRQRMFESRIELLRGGIVSEPERQFPAWTYEGGGAIKQNKAECLHRLEQRQCRVLTLDALTR